MSLQYHAVHVTERAATERFGGACTVDLWFFSFTYVRHALSASHTVCARHSTPSRHAVERAPPNRLLCRSHTCQTKSLIFEKQCTKYSLRCLKGKQLQTQKRTHSRLPSVGCAFNFGCSNRPLRLENSPPTSANVQHTSRQI